MCIPKYTNIAINMVKTNQNIFHYWDNERYKFRCSLSYHLPYVPPGSNLVESSRACNIWNCNSELRHGMLAILSECRKGLKGGNYSNSNDIEEDMNTVGDTAALYENPNTLY